MKGVFVALLLLVTVSVQAQDSSRAGARTYAPTPDGVRLRYVIAGRGRDTVIVPLASWLEEDLAWLAEGRAVVFYDPRGRGGSSLPDDSAAFGWRTDISDIDALRRHLRLERVSLLGTSYYAAVVGLYAAHYPTRVRRIVMVAPQRPAFDTRYRYNRSARQTLDTTVVRALEDMRRAGLDGVDPQGFCRAELSARLVPSLMGDPDLAATMRADPCAFSNEWPSRAAVVQRFVNAANGRWDWRLLASRMVAPALIVHGTDDPVSPLAAGREWARRMRDARIVGIEGAGHAPWLDGQPVLRDVVNDFLNGNWPAGSEVVRAPNPR